MSNVASNILVRMVARVGRWIGLAPGPSEADATPVDAETVAAPARQVQLTDFKLAARLIATDRLNAPKSRKPRIGGAANRPTRIETHPKRQERETRHVWLAVRHSPATAGKGASVTPLLVAQARATRSSTGDLARAA